MELTPRLLRHYSIEEDIDNLALNDNLPEQNESMLRKIFALAVTLGIIGALKLSLRKLRVLKHILMCRTETAGINYGDVCEHCGHVTPHYSSCGDSCCPFCGNLKRAIRAEQQSRYLLPVNYYHVVFTIPPFLNSLFLTDPKFMGNLLFRSVKETMEWLKDKKNDTRRKYNKPLIEQLGYMLNYHSWGSCLNLHPHLHMLMAGAGIDSDYNLIPLYGSNSDFIIPVKDLATKFRNTFLRILNEEHENSKLTACDPKWLLNLLEDAYAEDWNIELRKTPGYGKNVIKYLSRYFNRIAISSSRIVSVDKNKVTFRYKNYRNEGKMDVTSLDLKEFVRRFFMHVPPAGFQRNRFYGFWGSRNRDERFEKIWEANAAKPVKETRIDVYSLIDSLKFGESGKKESAAICINCGKRRQWFIE